MQPRSEPGAAESGTKRVSRKRTCIICGNKASSAEHVFPSALGGRRTNKGIYCKAHNNWFGCYVTILQNQLSLINALLEVQPDRGNINPFVTNDKHGRRVELLGANVTLAPDLDRVLDNALDGSPQSVQMDPVLVKSLQDRARKRGLVLQIDESYRFTEWQTDPIQVSLVFGGEPFLRAVAYLAITFSAHFWPEIARSEGLAGTKAMIRSGDIYKGDDCFIECTPANDFVDFTSIDESNDLTVPHTAIGHTIIVCVSNRKLLSRVSLFGILNFKILLGDCDSIDKSVVTRIDPLQLVFGDDWKVDHLDYAVLSEVMQPMPLASDVLASDKMQLAMSDLFARIQGIQMSREYSQARKELKVMASLESQARLIAAQVFVQSRRQRILRLVSHLANEPTADPIGIIVKSVAKKMVEDGPKTESGLSLESARVLDALTDEFALEVHARSSNELLSEENYNLIFNGGVGLFIVASFFLAPLRREFGNDP